ncbi:MAG: ACT domain-containing protein, partial [Dehalococcoidia bacterium]
KVALVGTGILTDPAYVGRMFRVLADAGVNVLAIGTSEIRISCLVHRADGERAGQALNAAFQVNSQL